MQRLLASIALAAGLAGAAMPAEAGAIDTFPLWNGANTVFPWGGAGNTETYGQTFAATASDNVLTGITFAITNPGAPIPFQAFVYGWGGSSVSGAALFTSAVQQVPTTSGLQQVSVAVPSLALTPGQSYVAFFTTTTTGLVGGTTEWGYLGPDPINAVDGYTGGEFVFLNDANFSGITGPWEFASEFGGNDAADLAFELDFAAVPEPGTLLLMALPLLLAATMTRRPSF
jgi:hypothetical protein